MSSAFPTGFLWGAAGSGHQTEGDNSLSDIWFAEHVEPTIFREPSGPACDAYARWAEDVDLAADLGLNAYRFSVEWCRVEPVRGEIRSDQLDHYEAIVDRCRDRGLAPLVTLNHFTCPRWFAEAGGWLAPDAPELFALYCQRVAARFGDRMASAVTMNEPNLARMLEWAHLPDFVKALERSTLEACSRRAGVDRFRLANVILPEEMDAMADGMEAGHRAARAAIKAACPDLPVGLSVAIVDDQVVGPDAALRDRKRAEVYERWLILARDDDFVGVQNYERLHYDAAGEVPPEDGRELNSMGTGIYPESLAESARYAFEVARVPVLVTEHGLSHLDDRLRAQLIPDALRGLAAVMEEGVPVLGYVHWSFLDNWRWIWGYANQLGLVAVDRETFVRTPKPSASVLGAIARANAVA
jgi:beta-glucosidase